MKTFLAVLRSEIKGVLSGWDCLRLRGTLRLISSLRGVGAYLELTNIALKHFREWNARALISRSGMTAIDIHVASSER
jgi:hypothetical protein